MAQNSLIFDVGMYDGTDTAYYLAKGFQVIAVEANTQLVEAAKERFAGFIHTGRLIIEHVAISDHEGTVELYLSGQDLGSSSIEYNRVVNRKPSGSIKVRCVRFENILDRFGAPFYLKCDIEGADRHTILALSAKYLPEYVSFEMGEDAIELLDHLAAIGYRSFKIINQVNFRELSRIDYLPDRIRGRMRRMLHMPEPDYVTYHGFQFRREHGAGPMAEDTDGQWKSYLSIRTQWQQFCNDYSADNRGGWYDLHARFK